MKESSNNLVITFTKRIFQTAIPMSMTLLYNSKKHEDQILIADSNMKFKIFDKNTFEILQTYNGPIYDSYVKQFVSIFYNLFSTTSLDEIVKYFHPLKSHISETLIFHSCLLGFHFKHILILSHSHTHTGCKHIIRINGLLKVLYFLDKQKYLYLCNGSRR